MVKIVVFLLLLLVVVSFALVAMVNGVIATVKKIRHTDTQPSLSRFLRFLTLSMVGAVVCAGFVLFTQLTASTPPIVDADGNMISGSIAELVQLDLNDRKEWVSIRGRDAQKPILLFLAGGPGGTHMPFMRQYMPYLEEDFVVVNWDQPGSGKSYMAVSSSDLTVDMYVEDGIALTKYLCDRFGQEKIYLLGESWGSALGIFMADRYPEGYHAFFGTGQMVAFLETEIIDYNLALELAREEGNTQLVNKLEQNGPPPYYGNSVALKSADYLGYLDDVMRRHPDLNRVGGNKFMTDIVSSEYGLADKLFYFLGVLTSFNNVYPQLYPVDLRTDYPKLDVPVYFLLGRLDINAPLSLSTEYFELLDAPYKELVWFEHSSHAPWAYEREGFCKKIVDAMNEIKGD